MPDSPLHIRRSRRTDFDAVMKLLGASGVLVPPPDRATLRRFRHIVADLGTDFYLALVDGTPVGLVHVTYARELGHGPRAGLNQLVVADSFRRRGIGAALLDFATCRARKRGCAMLSCTLPATGTLAREFFAMAGLEPAGEYFVKRLASDE
ncbi:MAG: GNAT family N-acetyltransferase [Candidatus Binatia bacterium]